MKTIISQLTNSLLLKVTSNDLHRQHIHAVILKYATLHLLLKLCTILGSLVWFGSPVWSDSMLIFLSENRVLTMVLMTSPVQLAL